MIEISVVIVAVAFAILVLFLIKTLNAATKSLEKTTETLQEVKRTIDELGFEVKHTVRLVNDITVDVQSKMKQIEPVMESVHNIGEVLNEVTYAAKQVSSTVSHKFKKGSSKSTSVIPTNTDDSNYSQTPSNGISKMSNNSSSGGLSWLKYVDVAAGIWQKFRR